eukprot:jgi/Chrzof1/5093/Cz15g11060.t1
MSKPPSLPARGVLAGIKGDLKRSKEQGAAYDHHGAGAAWSHNFLNQKPWHPLNFRNQVKKWEAEQQTTADQKAKEQAQAEFQAEQEKLQALQFLSKEDAAKQKAMASLAFMYAKPPGLEAALARDKEVAEKAKREKEQAEKAAAAAADKELSTSQTITHTQSTESAQQQHQRPPQQQQQQHLIQLDRLREDPFAAVLAAKASLQHSDKFILKEAERPHGGMQAIAANQQLLLEEEEEPQPDEPVDDADALLASLSEKERRAVLKALDKKRRRQEEKAKLQRAQEVLRLAGYDMEQLQDGNSSSSDSQSGGDAAGKGSKRRRSDSKQKHKHKHKHRKSKSRHKG